MCDRHPLPCDVAHSGEHGTRQRGAATDFQADTRVILPNRCHGESGEMRHRKGPGVNLMGGKGSELTDSLTEDLSSAVDIHERESHATFPLAFGHGPFLAGALQCPREVTLQLWGLC